MGENTYIGKKIPTEARYVKTDGFDMLYRMPDSVLVGAIYYIQYLLVNKKTMVVKSKWLTSIKS